MTIYNFNEFVNEGLFFKKRIDFKWLEKNFEKCQDSWDVFTVKLKTTHLGDFANCFKNLISYMIYNKNIISKNNADQLVNFLNKIRYFMEQEEFTQSDDTFSKITYLKYLKDLNSDNENFVKEYDKIAESMEDITIIEKKIDRITGKKQINVSVAKNIVDRILDKVSKYGYNKLTEEEKEILKRESEK